MSTMNRKVDPLNEERSVIDNLIASSQNLMGSSQSPVPEQCHKPSDYPTADSKSKMILKSRRGRTSFSPGQLSDLEAAFTNTHYPDFQTRKDLSNTLKIPDDRIQVWFQNRRAKWRKTQRHLNTTGVINSHHGIGSQTIGNPSSNVLQNPEIPLGYHMARPSPIRHTASPVRNETKSFDGNNPISISQATVLQPQQPLYLGSQQQKLGSMFNIYEKSGVPPTNAEMSTGMPNNQITAPSLYSLSAAVTSSGQYIILGTTSKSNPVPSTYALSGCSNYPGNNASSEKHNY